MQTDTISEDQKPKIIKEIDDLIGAISYQLRGSNLIGKNKKPTSLKQPKGIIGGELKYYQLQSLSWMVQLANNNLSGILADDMGLGKTVQAISYLSHVQDTKKINGKHIIIVPKNVLNNWKREFAHWNPTFRVITLPGTEEQREHVLKTKVRTSQFDVLIATYYSVRACESTLKRFLWETFIVDEAHSIKNSQTSISTCLRNFKSKFTLLLTGTPLSNDLLELWSLLNFIVPQLFSDPGLFERIQKSVDSQCKCQEDKIKYQCQIAARFKAVISPFMLRRVKSEINLGLKEKKEISIFVSLSEIQLTMYRNYLKTKSVYGDSRTQQSKPTQLRKICGHPYLFSDIQDPNAPPYGEHLVQTSGKLKLLDKLLVKLFQENHKVLIFSQFVVMLKILEDYCRYRSYKYEVISGESSLQQRDDAIDRFSNSQDTNVFLISTRAGGVGLNLVAADIVIMYDLDWNPQMDKQAMDRAYRIGQKRSVKIFKLVTNNTIQERILEVQKYKLIWDELVIQKGGLAKIKSAQQKFQKMDLNNLAGWGAEQIFKFQQNYDDNTIEQIIKMSEQKDNKVTQDIKKKLQKELENVGETLNPYEFFEDYAAKDVGKDFKPKILGESKLEKRVDTIKNSKKIHFVEPKIFQLYGDYKQAGQLLFNLSESVEEEQRLKMIEKLRQLGFYDWSASEYEDFVQANCNVIKTDYKEISKRINTKDEREVEEYSNKFYEKAQKIESLKKDLKKIMKKQKQFECSEQLSKLQKRIKAYDWNLFYLKIRSSQKTMSNDTYLRMYFNDIRQNTNQLGLHQQIIQRFNTGLLSRTNKVFIGQNRSMMYKKIVDQMEEGTQKNRQILNSRYQFLYKKYCPELNLAKSSSKSKDTIKVSIGKDDESNETVAKNELQIAD